MKLRCWGEAFSASKKTSRTKRPVVNQRQLHI